MACRASAQREWHALRCHDAWRHKLRHLKRRLWYHFQRNHVGQDEGPVQLPRRPDGAIPAATLINVNGTLYGTTHAGGNSGCGLHAGCGTVYSISTTGAENMLYRFTGGADGATPAASLLELSGTLYGTTSAGSAHRKGTVFSISTSGDEQVLHSFGGPDGAEPEADLLNVNGTPPPILVVPYRVCQKLMRQHRMRNGIHVDAVARLLRTENVYLWRGRGSSDELTAFRRRALLVHHATAPARTLAHHPLSRNSGFTKFLAPCSAG